MSHSSGEWAGIRRGGAVDSLSGGSVVFLPSENPRGYQARSSDVREGQGPERAARRPSRRQETAADLTVLSRRSSAGSSRPEAAGEVIENFVVLATAVLPKPDRCPQWCAECQYAAVTMPIPARRQNQRRQMDQFERGEQQVDAATGTRLAPSINQVFCVDFTQTHSARAQGDSSNRSMIRCLKMLARPTLLSLAGSGCMVY
jgi:hypothetical protein